MHNYKLPFEIMLPTPPSKIWTNSFDCVLYICTVQKGEYSLFFHRKMCKLLCRCPCIFALRIVTVLTVFHLLLYKTSETLQLVSISEQWQKLNLHIQVENSMEIVFLLSCYIGVIVFVYTTVFHSLYFLSFCLPLG